MVIGSDILYLRVAYEPLLRTITAVMKDADKPPPTVLLAFATSRAAEHEPEFRRLAKVYGFSIDVMHRADPGSYVYGDILQEAIMILQLKQLPET